MLTSAKILLTICDIYGILETRHKGYNLREIQVSSTFGSTATLGVGFTPLISITYMKKPMEYRVNDQLQDFKRSNKVNTPSIFVFLLSSLNRDTPHYTLFYIRIKFIQNKEVG